ncbi:hypothetical protein J4E86_010444 [Alternaria arbusti]|uniref:uncharacterized protein n=1 Tax=Alternaria arbusti TaxID=232088 RepID=UPI00221EF881|nr:uncharacterized protein J4E86_010444 [Alternaria arbusti]KAI4941412.1 hypothetical protein J4E86_010444 [Alternaria arbusti]
MSVEVALAVVATVDLAIKYGERLVDLYNSYRNASDEIKERVLLMRNSWFRIQTQLRYLERIKTIQGEEFKIMQDQTLRVLQIKLEAAVGEVQNLEKKRDTATTTKTAGATTKETKYHNWKYPFVKKSLDAAISELQKWQQAFDPSWYLALMMSNRLIDSHLQDFSKSDSELPPVDRNVIYSAIGVRESLKPESGTGEKKKVFLPDNATSGFVRTPISYSTAFLCQTPDKSQTFILDSVPSQQGIKPDIQVADVRDLARKLNGADALSFGLLRCFGVAKVCKDRRTTTAYDFVFYIPSSVRSPQSLRNILIEAKPNVSLSTRFRLALQLARSVTFVHTYKFVHKGIRPETILVFDAEKSEYTHSFLVGFEKFRAADGRTVMAGDAAWEKDLYRHPERQGLRPESEYTMQHDIYSLGMCLLEIGMWRTLVTYSSTKEASPSQLLPPPGYTEKKEVTKAASLKETLVGIAQRELPSCMGDKYTDIVVTCLRCLDEDNPEFGDKTQFEDEDGITIGVRYIQKVSNKTLAQLVQY